MLTRQINIRGEGSFDIGYFDNFDNEILNNFQNNLINGNKYLIDYDSNFI
jgi:hypothetical protein